MCKKIILLLLICCLSFAGFAQKNKRKTTPKAPKNTYFEILINEKNIHEDRYCPFDTLLFTFQPKGDTIADYKFLWWYENYSFSYHYTDTIKLIFPYVSNVNSYQVSLCVEILAFNSLDTIIPVSIRDTIFASVSVDYIKTILDTTVCQGREISVILGDTIYNYKKVESNIETPWKKYKSASGCDSLVRWNITMNPYIEKEYRISSCDSVTWGLDSLGKKIVIKREKDKDGDYTTDPPIERIFYVNNPPNYCCDCDTLIKLTVTIVDTAKLEIVFDQKTFCDGDDMKGEITLETNFTAFNWKNKYRGMDTTIFRDKKLGIEYPGVYEVWAYMDTSLYDTLRDLRIVNSCSFGKDTLVADCDLLFPNVITPNDTPDGLNDVLGIKKLNTERENELTIYDRWGKIVFHQKNYKCLYKGNKYHNDEDAFRGISRGGQKLPVGTYYYAFKYKAFPDPKTYKGIIMIMR